MSKRIDKKRQKRQSDTTISANAAAIPGGAAPASFVPAPEAPATAKMPYAPEQIDFFIQYQDQEYLAKDITEKIKKKCEDEGKEVTGEDKLSVYLKPEDRKAYFTYAGYSSFVDI